MPDIQAKSKAVLPFSPPIDVSDLFPDYARAEVTSMYGSIVSIELQLEESVKVHRTVIRMDTNWLLNSLEKIRRGQR